MRTAPIWRWGLGLALLALPPLRVSAQSCLAQDAPSGCAARIYAELLCAHFDRPGQMQALQQQLAQRLERADLDLAGVTPEEVETLAVRTYTPLLCPQRSEQIRRLFRGL